MQYVAIIGDKRGRILLKTAPCDTREEAARLAFTARPRAKECSTQEATLAGSDMRWTRRDAIMPASPKAKTETSAKRSTLPPTVYDAFDHGDRDHVQDIAAALGWQRAEIAAEGKGWVILFTDAAGEVRRSHTKGVAATQLRQWISGAWCMKALVDRERADLKAKNSEAIVWAVEDAKDADLVKEVNKRAEAGDIDLAEEFGDKIELGEDLLRAKVERYNADQTSPRDELHIMDGAELEAHAAAVLSDSALFEIAGRLAYGAAAEVPALQSELRHVLKRDFNVYGSGSAQLRLCA